MAKLLSARYNRLIEKLFSTKEGRASIDTVSPEIQAELPLFNGAENRYLEGWLLNAQRFAIAAGAAGTFAQAELRNPAGSNTIVVLMEASAGDTTHSDAPLLILVHGLSTDLPTASNVTTSLDARATGGSATRMSQGNAATTQPAGITMQKHYVNSEVEFLTNGTEIPILPGDAVVLTANTTAQQSTFSIMWRERVIEPSESF